MKPVCFLFYYCTPVPEDIREWVDYRNVLRCTAISQIGEISSHSDLSEEIIIYFDYSAAYKNVQIISIIIQSQLPYFVVAE